MAGRRETVKTGSVHPFMSPARQRAVDELVELSESILRLCESGEWKQALEEQRRRRGLLDRFFATPCLDTESTSVAAMIEILLETDHRVSELLYRHRGEMLESAQSERRNAGNVGHYLANAR